MIKVTVWNEYLHEKTEENVRTLHPDGLHNTIKNFLNKNEDFRVVTATLDEPEHGLTKEVLENTDVLIWWGHLGHNLVSDEVANSVHDAVLRGMGFIALHSAHQSKPFTKLMGTSGRLRWREDDYERLWCIMPNHAIAEGIPDYIDLGQEEMYGEFFDIPTPDELIFIGWFSGGEVFRSGCTWNRGLGKVFYFQPGHETCRSFENEYIQKIIANTIRWAKPAKRVNELECICAVPSPEQLKNGNVE
jgi:trehalose utilization protein